MFELVCSVLFSRLLVSLIVIVFKMKPKRLKRNAPAVVNYEMSENEMPKTYTEIVIKTIKFIVSQKQIPFSYETLKSVATKKGNPCEQMSLSQAKKIRIQNKATEAFKAMEQIFQHLTDELEGCNNGDIEEIMVVIGSTPVSAKEIYRIQIPPMTCYNKQPNSKLLCCGFLRNMLKSEELHQVISQSLSPTNVYVFVKKPAGRRSEWLLPKDQYCIPLCCPEVVFSFTHNIPQRHPDFHIYNDSSATEDEVDRSPCLHIYSEESNFGAQSREQKSLVQQDVDSLQWYQSKIMFKGFKNS